MNAGVVVGLVHPGSMGAAVGAQLAAGGVRTLWVSEGRGPATRRRAAEAGLEQRAAVADLAECSLILSICPPAAAREVAASVAATGFRGVYLDANAISPGHAQQIEALFAERGEVTVVDGGIVGPPPAEPARTRLYLSGPDDGVAQVVDLFAPTTVRPFVLDGPVGKASALKLSFATYSKLTFVLAAQSYALATRHGVDDALRELAGDLLADTPLGRPDTIASAGQRAWRWEGEMAEIAAACADSTLRSELLAAAQAVFAQWRPYKDDDEVTVARLVRALRLDHG